MIDVITGTITSELALSSQVGMTSRSQDLFADFFMTLFTSSSLTGVKASSKSSSATGPRGGTLSGSGTVHTVCIVAYTCFSSHAKHTLANYYSIKSKNVYYYRDLLFLNYF